MRIGVFGSCRVKDPLGAIGAEVSAHPSFGHIHNPLEILQALDLIEGRREPPPEWLDLLNIRRPERLRQQVEADVFVVEVSSLRLVEFDGWQLQIHRFREMLQAAGAPPGALKVLYGDMDRWRAEADALAAALPGRAAQVLRASRHREMTGADVESALDQIAGRLGRPVLFVGPVAEGLGHAPPQRAILRDAIAAWGRRNHRLVLDPTRLVEDADLKDPAHYREDAWPRIGAAIQDSARKALALATSPQAPAPNASEPAGGAVPPLLTFSVAIDGRRSLTGAQTRFQFVGYARDEVGRMEQDILAIEMSGTPQLVVEVADARLTPVGAVHANAFSGNVFDAEGRPHPLATIEREGEVVFGADADSRPGTAARSRLPCAWYGGVAFSGYGHVLLESLAHLSPEALASPLPILFHYNCDGPPDRRGFAQILARLGVDPGRVRWVEDVTEVDRLLMSEPGFVIGSRVHLPWAAMLRKAVRDRLDLAAAAGAAPAFLSRSALKGARRKAFGEVELEAALAPAMRIVHPETLSFSEQAALVNATDRLIGPVGSQMHNLLLRARDSAPEVVYLCHARPPRAFYQVDLLWGGSRTYVNAASYGRVFAFGGASPYLLRLDRIHAGLLAAGYPIPEDFAPDAEAIARMEEDFYRTWIERFIDMKLIRPSRYAKSEAEMMEKAESFAALLAERLQRAMADPQVAELLRSGARAALDARPARSISEAVKARFLDLALGAA